MAADDRRAFGRLVEEYQPQLRRFLQNLAQGDAALAADIAQETFIKAYTGLRSYQGAARFKTWLYRIACNEFYSYQRKIRERLDDTDEVRTDIPAPDQNAASDARMDVERCLRELSDQE
ncbi:MAG: sigma-70 family RNA polymerase sigma factor, partial [Muribaculaceae bacterium]|nr:sigma-70 family RNA polymerase sigma factor [Muribaculaceae bacterium]